VIVITADAPRERSLDTPAHQDVIRVTPIRAYSATWQARVHLDARAGRCHEGCVLCLSSARTGLSASRLVGPPARKRLGQRFYKAFTSWRSETR